MIFSYMLIIFQDFELFKLNSMHFVIAGFFLQISIYFFEVMIFFNVFPKYLLFNFLIDFLLSFFKMKNYIENFISWDVIWAVLDQFKTWSKLCGSIMVWSIICHDLGNHELA